MKIENTYHKSRTTLSAEEVKVTDVTEFQMKNIGRGLALSFTIDPGCKFVLNGSQIILIPKYGEVFDFERELNLPAQRQKLEDFNWTNFHKDLDQAMAIMLQENGINGPMPSQMSVMDFAGYSNRKRGEQNGTEIFLQILHCRTTKI